MMDGILGVIGIVSSKITEKYNKPSILIGFNEENLGRGSGRSIEGFDIHKAILNFSNDLLNCGGHAGAIGLSIEKKNFEKFKKEFEKYANENIDKKLLEKKQDIDLVIDDFRDLTIKNIEDLDLLKPYGEQNEEPIFEIDNLKIENIRFLTENKHLKLLLQDLKTNLKIDAIRL